MVAQRSSRSSVSMALAEGGAKGRLMGRISSFFLAMRMPGAHLERPRFVWHRTYWLYYVLQLLFVADQLLFGVNMARDIYLSKIAVSPDHIAPTLSLGITINHIVSMTIPMVGGLLWMSCGHTWVFIGAAGIALIMLGFSLLVPALPVSASGNHQAC